MVTNIFDMNNLCVRHYFSKDVEAENGRPNINLWKYRIIESIYNSLRKEDDINEIVLAVDDRKSWRKLFWNRYKESREGKRHDSKVDWSIFFDEYEKLTSEITEHLPFKIMKIHLCEADDIIAVICLEREKKQYIVISNDEDFLQLSSDRVRIYNPSKMLYMKVDDTEHFIVEKCLIGQKKDDIFNIITPLDWPKDKRKPGFAEKSAEKVMKEGYKEWLIKNNLERRFQVNRTLIDFKLIPQTIKVRILNEYDNYRMPDPSKIYDFFKKNNFTGFLNDISNVENNLLRLL